MSSNLTLEDLKNEFIFRRLNERSRYWEPCVALEEHINKLKRLTPGDKGLYICILRGGNGIAKSTFSMILADYMSKHIDQPFFDAVPYLKEFPRPCRGRLFTTHTAAKMNYPPEMMKWLPKRYNAFKDGSVFDRHFKYPNGSEWDILTFNQDPEEGESVTLRWAIVDEPMSKALWGGLISRFRFGGIIFLNFTPLRGAGWYADELEIEERIGKDVIVSEIASEEACLTHGRRGHLPHDYIEGIKANTDPDEYGARIEGKYLNFSGLVFKTAKREIHVRDFEPYHQECFDKGLFSLYHVMDPHPRKPFAMAWFAVFPNEDAYCIAEWPGFMFHKVKSSGTSLTEYVDIIRKTENSIGKVADMRIIDPNSGLGPSEYGGNSVIEFFEANKLYFKPCWNDGIDDGHIAVKLMLGDDTRNIRSQLYFLPHCVNAIFALFHYAWAEGKNERAGISEKPELIYKDFMDLVRYFAVSKPQYLKQMFGNLSTWKPRERGGGYRGA